MENHDDALRVWRESGVRGGTLVHVDAHHDAWLCERESEINIANFVSAALRGDTVERVYWVLPDGSWRNRRTRRHVFWHLLRITQQTGAHPPAVAQQSISATVLGKQITAVPLQFLPPVPGPVILDLDTDFMVIERVTFGAPDVRSTLPWCWPEGVLGRLEAAGIAPRLATIAYSVTGGYTPLEWKYLGDELAQRLCGEDHECADLLRAGAKLEAANDSSAAAACYRRAAQADPAAAAPWYRLALLSRALGSPDEARESYRQAVQRDVSYRTPYRSRGFTRYIEKRFRDAEQEHRQALVLDPEDAYFHMGVGAALAAQGRRSEASRELQLAADLNPELPDARALLGDLLQRAGRHAEAVSAYDEYLRLSLAGHKTLQAAICTQDTAATLDAQHFQVHAKRAAAMEKLGRCDLALQEYRIALAVWRDDVRAQLGVARCCWAMRQFGAACRAVGAVAGQSRRSLRAVFRRRWDRRVSGWKSALAILQVRVAPKS